MVLLSGLTVMFLAGVPMWIFLGGGGVLAAALPIVYSMMHDYQRKRVLIFLDPESDPLGAGYHITQSKIAIGSGGIWGKGYLNGSQSHLDYLPEGHTDFVFATMVEEWGLLGGVLLIFAFAGIEAALVPSGEVREPARTVPRAIALAMIGVTLLYVLLQNPTGSGTGVGLSASTPGMVIRLVPASQK